jgi:hypothetical protein
LITALCVVAAVERSFAQLAGALDTTYGTDGVTNVKVNHTLIASTVGQVLGYQSDGKVLLALNNEASLPRRSIAIMRFSQDGVVDLTYGDRGIAYINVISGVDPLYGPSCWMVVDGTLMYSKDLLFCLESDLVSISHLHSVERDLLTIFVFSPMGLTF